MKKRWIIILLFVLLLIVFLYGWLFGFPWERQKGIAEVKKYVEETYHLTTTDISLSFSPDGMNTAFVSTKELPFNFQVYISRNDRKVWGDLYLEKLVEHNIERKIVEKVGNLVDENNIKVVLENRFSRTNPELDIEDINLNPDIVFKLPQIVYFCSINDIQTDYERSFSIFKEITKNFNPTRIYFHYNEKDNEKFTICIKKEDFIKINNSQDLLLFEQ